VRTSQKSLDTGKAMLKFFDWGFKSTRAKADAAFLDFVPMPASVISKVEAVWHSLVMNGSTPVWP
jgi:hypothetical protein